MPIIEMEDIDNVSSELQDIVPDGQYPCIVRKVEVKDNKEKPGQRINITCEITEGDYQGKNQWVSIGIPNPDMTPRGQDFCKRLYKRFIIACGLEPVKSFDTNMLMGRPVVLVIGMKRGKNEVKDFLPVVE